MGSGIPQAELCSDFSILHIARRFHKDQNIRFREREEEVVVLAYMKWQPGVGHNHWEFFDTNHSAERTFKWPLAEHTPGEPVNTRPGLRNPWRKMVPTLTCLSQIVGRVFTENDYGD